MLPCGPTCYHYVIKMESFQLLKGSFFTLGRHSTRHFIIKKASHIIVYILMPTAESIALFMVPKSCLLITWKMANCGFHALNIFFLWQTFYTMVFHITQIMVDFGYNVWCDCRVMPLYLLKNSNFCDFRVQTLVFLDG